MAFNLRRPLLSWLTQRASNARPSEDAPEETTIAQRSRARSARQSDGLPPGFFRLMASWLLLLLLGGVEFGASLLHFAPALRPLLMTVAVLMIAIIAISFMEVGKGPTIVRGFAVAAMFWLIVLLGLGSMDPLTRTNYLVPHVQVE